MKSYGGYCALQITLYATVLVTNITMQIRYCHFAINNCINNQHKAHLVVEDSFLCFLS